MRSVFLYSLRTGLTTGHHISHFSPSTLHLTLFHFITTHFVRVTNYSVRARVVGSFWRAAGGRESSREPSCPRRRPPAELGLGTCACVVGAVEAATEEERVRNREGGRDRPAGRAAETPSPAAAARPLRSARGGQLVLHHMPRLLYDGDGAAGNGRLGDEAPVLGADHVHVALGRLGARLGRLELALEAPHAVDVLRGGGLLVGQLPLVQVHLRTTEGCHCWMTDMGPWKIVEVA